MIRTESWSISTGFPHIQRPFVHGMVVGPMANPVILFNKRLERKDLPVLCGPAIEATAICVNFGRYFFIFDAIENLSGLLSKFKLIFDRSGLLSFFNHDKRNSFAVHLIFYHLKNIYKALD